MDGTGRRSDGHRPRSQVARSVLRRLEVSGRLISDAECFNLTRAATLCELLKARTRIGFRPMRLPRHFRPCHEASHSSGHVTAGGELVLDPEKGPCEALAGVVRGPSAGYATSSPLLESLRRSNSGRRNFDLLASERIERRFRSPLRVLSRRPRQIAQLQNNIGDILGGFPCVRPSRARNPAFGVVSIVGCRACILSRAARRVRKRFKLRYGKYT